jgi:RNA polymerase sigma factor for flagellar operon FliA
MTRDDRRSDEDMTEVWRDFKATGDEVLRNRLVERYHYLVRVIANRIAARLPRSIDVQDLRSAGVFGLIRAIENFDIARGTRFESYCATRVHGAILDELRAQDWVPRLVRNRAETYRDALGELRGALDREPSTRELAIHLGTTDEEVDALRRESNFATVFTLSRDDDASEDSGQIRKLDVLVDQDSEVPFDEMVTRDLAASLAKHLSQAERTVVALYYFDGLTMKEIGQVLRISESRVCQIHGKLLKKLHDRLEGLPRASARAVAAAPAPPPPPVPEAPRMPMPFIPPLPGPATA